MDTTLNQWYILKEKMAQNAIYTETNVTAVEDFLTERYPEWMQERKKELDKLKQVFEVLGKLDMSFSDIVKSGDKQQALEDYVLGNCFGDILWLILESELPNLLKPTVAGLEELEPFMEALGNLALTSVHVFKYAGRSFLPMRLDRRQVYKTVKTAKSIYPMLSKLRRENKLFFSPKLQNVREMVNRLDLYIRIFEVIFSSFKKRSEEVDAAEENINKEITEKEINNMLSLIYQLEEIRMNKDSRTAFMFQHISCSDFLWEFSRRQRQMHDCMEELEEMARQLDIIHVAAKVSRVVASSSHVLGGGLFVTGLVVSPLSAGASSVFVIAGSGLHCVGSAFSLIKNIKGWKYMNKANIAFNTFMCEANVLKSCFMDTFQIDIENPKNAFNKMKHGTKICFDIINLGLDTHTFLKDLLNKSPNVSVLSFVKHTFTIIKETISLAAFPETEFSQLIRAKITLWRSELSALQTIYESLRKAQDINLDILDAPFYPRVHYTNDF